ncbi:MAG TPA: DUF1080 domain-containing protein [Gemmataceae bacterium]|nr:DUF1080 domain-containing protein [Gemmataceae bacterium]
MRHLLAALFVLSLAVPVWAEDAKPNTLTPKEIAEGWILLFDGETNFGWRANEKGDYIKAGKGSLLLGGHLDGHQRIFAFPIVELNNFELRFDYSVVKGNDWKSFTLLFGSVFSSLTHGRTRLPIPDKDDEWQSVHFTLNNKKYTGSLYSKGKESQKWWGGTVGEHLRPVFDIKEGIQVALRNVKLKPLATKPLFNGKDLTGWKEFPGRKSKFSITKEGWLSVKNGNGDLQTTGQWADFVLQLECRTNGDNLNSGVFFRCIPGEYQNGYEAQIHNGHAKKPKTYTVEEYDPKTHKVLTKKKVENWSSDFGTGSIYRRVPARRAVAKDREWFTMTIFARGRHFATWVNGIQVADWIDNRPDNENPRNGCRLKKGAISLQGHDPTTDLNFRNIRIANLGAQ